MSGNYPNLLSPIKIGSTVFRNRLIASASKPHFVQGSETYPTEAMITHYANKAKNGAALVTCTGVNPIPVLATKYCVFDGRGYARHRVATRAEGPLADNIESFFSQLTEAIHFYGAKASMGIVENVPRQYDVSAVPRLIPSGGIFVSVPSEEIPADLLDEIAEDFALQAAFIKDQGFDMVYLHMSYRGTFLARFLSPLTNQRTDRYGGSLENRARFPIMVADRIKQRCGRNFLIEASMSGGEPAGGFTLEDTVEYARMFADHIDLLQLRAGEMDPAHPTGFDQESTPFLYMAEAVKKSGANIAVVTIGGYQNPDVCEEVIASGKADFIAMARSWIADPAYGRKIYEGRSEDIVPCIRCNKCHRSSYVDPMASVCSVNPIWGLEHKIERMIEPPIDKKKVAVVGGGPAGMETALVAAGRGHNVTLYEKSGTLGGLIKTADNVSFKWPLKDFKDYLVRQIEKSNVRVRLNTEATPETLKKEGYDVVLAAVGSESVVPDIPGVDGENVVFAQDVYGSEDALAEKVVIIGGGEVGVETGMHLAEKGHQVTVLEMLDVLALETSPTHYYSMFQTAWERLENFHYILQARCTGIGVDKVTYIDTGGVEHDIEVGSVVIAAGAQSKHDLAMRFYGAAARFYMIGDCDVAGNVQKAMRSAFSTASAI